MEANDTRPLRLLVSSFGALIAVGTALLLLPAATPEGQSIAFLDALFTATSATCVTGLVVRDTGTAFTPFGQAVILALIQLGGLGVMTFSLVILSGLGGRLSLTSRSVLTHTLAGVTRNAGLRPLLRSVVRLTLALELVGALVLFLRWREALGPSQAAWAAAFHSVSAFCNAGFSLWSDSLQRYRDDAIVNGVVMGLIVLGGLGFLVAHEVRRSWRRPQNLSLHTKVTLATTGWLIVAGTVAIWLVEREDSLAALPLGSQLLASLFQSVTSRTAGFSTVDLAGFTPAGLFLLTLMMFVGGSPGSCAGGIKTTTLGVLTLAAWQRIRGHAHVNAFHRSLGRATLENAVTITIGGVAVVLAGLFGMLSLQAPHSSLPELHGEFAAYLFEVVSALGTVGLSVGTTESLTPTARVLVTALMFVGRLGPLTVATALTRRSRRIDWRQAEEDVMVG
ncbi:MAG: TrkH family potassium uptake protein [Acidobacteriota bacterium]|jgi:trk system potassium uptake protein TrkH